MTGTNEWLGLANGIEWLGLATGIWMDDRDKLMISFGQKHLNRRPGQVVD
jgi:hypothetical protein